MTIPHEYGIWLLFLFAEIEPVHNIQRRTIETVYDPFDNTASHSTKYIPLKWTWNLARLHNVTRSTLMGQHETFEQTFNTLYHQQYLISGDMTIEGDINFILNLVVEDGNDRFQICAYIDDPNDGDFYRMELSHHYYDQFLKYKLALC